VFRYSRLAYLELGGELRDSASLSGGQAQDLAPGLAGKRAKDAVESVDLSVTHLLTAVLPVPFFVGGAALSAFRSGLDALQFYADVESLACR
jgi:hypothetical protein